MFCIKCGAQYQEGTAFCPKCGASILKPTQAQPAKKTIVGEIVTPDPVISKKRARIRLIIFAIIMIVFILQLVIGAVDEDLNYRYNYVVMRAMLTFWMGLGFICLCGFRKAALTAGLVLRYMKVLICIPVVGLFVWLTVTMIVLVLAGLWFGTTSTIRGLRYGA